MIVYENRFEQVRYLTGRGPDQHRPGAMSEIVLVIDRSAPNSPPRVLKRPVVSDRARQSISLEEQNNALIRENKVLSQLFSIRDKLKCEIPEIISFNIDEGVNYPPHKYHYLIMTKAPGETLATKSKPPALIAILNIYINIIKSLKSIHAKGIIYNDTRHEHFIWDREIDPIGKNKSCLTLIDFGNAFFLNSSEFNNLNQTNLTTIPTIANDYEQLGHSLFRVLTNSEFNPNAIQSGNLNLRTEYLIADNYILDFEKAIIKIIRDLVEYDIESAENGAQTIALALEQFRINHYSGIQADINNYGDWNSFASEAFVNDTILGEPDVNQLQVWKTHFEEFKNYKKSQEIQHQIINHIDHDNWAKILGTDLGHLKKHDPNLSISLESIIEQIKEQTIVYPFQKEVLKSLVKRDEKEAIQTLLDSIDNHLKIKSDELDNPILPFAKSVSEFTKDDLILNHTSGSFLSFWLVKDPVYMLQLYDRFEIAEDIPVQQTLLAQVKTLFKQAINAWTCFEFGEANHFTSQAISIDSLNFGLIKFQDHIKKYKRWLESDIVSLNNQPDLDGFTHPFLEACREINKETNEIRKLEIIGACHRDLIPKISGKRDIVRWANDQAASLDSIGNSIAKQAFDIENDPLIPDIVSEDSAIGSYYINYQKEWFLLCLILHKLVKSNELQEIRSLFNKKEHSFKECFHWTMLEAAIKYLLLLDEDKKEPAEISLAQENFKRASKKLNSHWLYIRLTENNVEEINTSIQKNMPKNEFVKHYESSDEPINEDKHINSDSEVASTPKNQTEFISSIRNPINLILFFLIITVIGSIIFFNFNQNSFSNATQNAHINNGNSFPIATPTAPVLSTTIDPIQDSRDFYVSDLCERAILQISRYDFNDASLNISECKTEPQKELISNLLSSIALNDFLYQQEAFSTDLEKLLSTLLEWESPDNNVVWQTNQIIACNSFLEFADQKDSKSMRDWYDNQYPNIQKTVLRICPWNPRQIIKVNSNIKNIHVFSVNQGSDNTEINLLELIENDPANNAPFSDRLYELDFRLTSAELETLTTMEFGDGSAPEVLKFDTVPQFQNQESSEIMIKIIWDYGPQELHISSQIFVPPDSITSTLSPGESLSSFSDYSGIPLENLANINHMATEETVGVEKTIYLIEPISSQVFSIPNVITDTLSPGESLSSFSDYSGIPLENLANINDMATEETFEGEKTIYLKNNSLENTNEFGFYLVDEQLITISLNTDYQSRVPVVRFQGEPVTLFEPHFSILFKED